MLYQQYENKREKNELQPTVKTLPNTTTEKKKDGREKGDSTISGSRPQARNTAVPSVEYMNATVEITVVQEPIEEPDWFDGDRRLERVGAFLVLERWE